jgi:hypothetical protein
MFNLLNFTDRCGVVYFGDVDIRGCEPRLFIGSKGRAVTDVVLGVFAIPGATVSEGNAANNNGPPGRCCIGEM